ncbi:MAG TPA: hypothetical protein VHY91_08115 [Pirellulales bacterium]|jgi:HEAT repeat protein|nr:hypothetical protein [Pirellulales bacterium]
MLRNPLKFALLGMLALPGQVAPTAHAQAPADAPAKAESPAAVDLRLEDPAVRSVLEDNPKTPAELVRAITVLADLDRAALAKPLLEKLLGLKLDARALAALAGEFDSAVFMKLARNPELAPQAAQLADVVLTAAAKERSNPAHLATLIAQLVDPKEGVRHRAANQILAAREAAVGPLLRALADSQQANLHPAVLAIFSQLGDEAAGPLSGALASSNEPIALAAVHALGKLQSASATADLLALAITSDPHSELSDAAHDALARILGHRFTAEEAREFFRSDINRLLDQARKQRDVSAPTDGAWRWDEKTSNSVLVNLPPADLGVQTAARYGRALQKIVQDAADERLALLARLTAAKYAAPDHPLPAGPGTLRTQAGELGAGVVEGVLIDAMARGQTWAAAAAAEILGDVGTQELLDTSSAALSPLAQAVRSGDRRLRFAAVDAILRLHPTRSFAGAGSIVDALTFFAATSGNRRALIGHPRLARSQELASLLSTLGYQGDGATNSRQFMELASRCPDYELALIDVSLANPPVDDLIGRLRRDPRTADLPIGLMVGDDMRKAAQRLAAGWPRVVAIARIADEHSLQFEVEQVLASAGRDHVGHEARQTQAAAALDWLAKLADFPSPLFNLDHVTPAVERSLYVPAFTNVAARVLADLPDAAAQRTLVEMASEGALPAETRRVGAVAFGRNVRRHGIHLTAIEIRKQYDRYNASRLQDEATQKILGSILDAIEDRAAGAEPNEPGR